MERADEPTVEGTPINRDLFESIETDLQHKNYVVGTYTGNSTEDRSTQDINLGFTPSMVFVVLEPKTGTSSTATTTFSTLSAMAITGSDYVHRDYNRTLLAIKANGFTVANYVSSGAAKTLFNGSGIEYKYIAFE